MSLPPPDRDPFAATEAGSLGGDAEDDRDPQAATDPAHIGRFTVTARLGAGAMGVVFAGKDDVLGRKVAIKLISPGRSASTEARDRMLREAQALAKLSHPNVVPVYEAGTHEGQIFVAMEYVEGRTLRQYATDPQTGWRAIVAAYIQAGRGLSAAHDAGLVHRDFKPDNAMLGDDGRVRVLDFGLVAAGGTIVGKEARTLEDDGDSTRLTRTGSLVGTPAYMAPEQYKNHPIDARADQFAFCVALHEAVYGVRPHAANSIAALSVAVIEGNIDAPKRRDPKWLYRVLRRGFATDPEQRFSDLHVLVRELERGLGRRRRAWIVGASCTAAVGLVIASRLALGPAASEPSVDPTSIAVGPAPVAMPKTRQVTRLSDEVQIRALALSPDGATVAYWAVNGTAHELVIAPSNGGPGVATRRGSVAPTNYVLRFARDGGVYSLQPNPERGVDLMLTSARDASQRRVRTMLEPDGVRGGTAHIVAILPNGALAILREDALYIDDGTAERRTLEINRYAAALTWSPDGRRLAWIEGPLGSNRIVLASADGEERGEIPVNSTLVSTPCLPLTFAGNDSIVYAVHESQSGLTVAQVWEQPLDEARLAALGDARALTDVLPGKPCELRASDDGRQIAFSRLDVHETIRVAAIRSDGRLDEVRPITTDVSDENLLGWTHDSRRVIFESERSGERALYTRNLQDEAVTRVYEHATKARLLRDEPGGLLLLDPATEPGVDPPVLRVAPGSVEVLGRIDVGPSELLGRLSCSPSLCTALRTENGEYVVRELEWSGREPRDLARVPSRPGWLYWRLAPDGKRGALVGRADVDVVPLDGRATTRHSIPQSRHWSVTPQLHSVTWSADGAALFLTGMYLDEHYYVIIRMDLDGSYEVVHAEKNRWMREPHVSPDGRHLAFTAWDFSGQVWLLER